MAKLFNRRIQNEPLPHGHCTCPYQTRISGNEDALLAYAELFGVLRWGTIRRQLAYKAEWAGKQCVAVNPKDISNRCSKFGSVDPTANASPRQYRCGSCDYVGDRAVNAALNILNTGFPDLPGHSPNGAKLLSIGAAGFQINRSTRTVCQKYVTDTL